VAWVSRLSIPRGTGDTLGPRHCKVPPSIQPASRTAISASICGAFQQERLGCVSVVVLFELEDSRFLPARLKSAKVCSGSLSE
jgi:hypothetical protein